MLLRRKKKRQATISGATAAVREKLSDMGRGVQAKTRAAGNAFTEGVRRGNRVGSDATQRLQKGYANTGDRFQEGVEEYSLAVAVGFLGVGLLTGLLLPRTPQEDKLMGEKSDQLIEQVKESGKETLDKAKRVAQTTMDETGARPFKGSVRYNYRLRFVEALPRTAESRVDFSLGSQARRVLIARCQPRRKPPPQKRP